MLVGPVLLILMFDKGAHVPCFQLHLRAAELMLPYFFAARHHNYARYGALYLHWMHNLLPDDLYDAFVKKEQLFAPLTEGLFNGI